MERMSQVVIYLKKVKFEAYRVEEGVKVAEAETEWDPENLVERLKKVKEKFGCESVRVLVAAEIAGT